MSPIVVLTARRLGAAAALGFLLSAPAVRSHAAVSAGGAPEIAAQRPGPATPAGRESAPRTAGVECMATDNWESGNANQWTVEGTWGVTPFAQAGTWAFTDSPVGPYEQCGTGPECGYLSRSATLTAPLALDAGSNASIKFDHICITENCPPPAAPCDAGVVEISTDNGTTWIELARYDVASDPAWGDMVANPDDWRPANIDISAYAGNLVKIRFRLESDALLPLDGWYIDNFRIEGCGVTPTEVSSWGWLKTLYR